MDPTPAPTATTATTAAAAPSPLRPVRRRHRRRVPFVAQRDATDCAAACLAMITAYHDRPVGLARLRDLANVDADGASFYSLARAAETLGFHARGLQLGYASLADVQLPAIAHWQGNHYVVVHRVERRSLAVCDPALGARSLGHAEFEAGWTGRLLELVPTERLVGRERAESPWRRFIPVVRPFAPVLGEVLLASLAVCVLGLGMPLGTQFVVDEVLAHRQTGFLDLLLAAMLLAAFFRSVLQFVRQTLLVQIATSCDARLIADFLQHVFALPLRFFDLRRVGDTVSRVRETEKVRQALASTLPSVVLDAALAVGYLALLCAYGQSLAWLVVAALPVFAGLMAVFSPIVRRNEREQYDRFVAAHTALIEAVSGIQTVKALALEPLARWRLESLFASALVCARRSASTTTLYAALASFVQAGCGVLFLWAAAHAVGEGGLTAGQMLAFATIASSVLTPVANLAASWDELQEARNSAARLCDVLECESEQGEGRRSAPVHFEGCIRFDGVTFAYGADQTPVLREVELTIPAGQRVAVVGPSGSGKTTLVKLILGLYRPTRGRVTIDGHAVDNLSLAALRRRVGVVPQDLFLFSGTVRDNVAALDPDVPFARVEAAARAAGAHEFICQLGLGYDTEIGERGVTLSGGQRQRLVLARALLRDPDILLLDEATASLDGLSERDVQLQLDAACLGRTTVVVAHRLSTVRNADRILVMDRGRIVEDGTHTELLARGGLYAALVGAGEVSS